MKPNRSELVERRTALIAQREEHATKAQDLILSGEGEYWRVERDKATKAIKEINQDIAAIDDLLGTDFEPDYKKSLPVEKNAAKRPAELSGDSDDEIPASLAKAYFVNAMRAIRDKNDEARKALQLENSPLGGWQIPPSVAPDIIQALRPALVFSSLGARMRPLVDGRLPIRKRDSRPNVYWIGEGKQIGTTDRTGSRIELVAKYAAAIIEVSNRLLNSSQGMMVEQDLRQELITELQLAFEYAYLYGVGAVPSGASHNGAQPLGLTLYSNINVHEIGADPDGSTNASAAGGPFTLVDASRAKNMVERSNAPAGGVFSWLAHPIMKGQLRELKDGENRHYFWEAPYDSDKADTLFGDPIRWTTQIPVDLVKGGSSDCTQMIGGFWGHFNIGEPGDLRMDANAMSDSAYQYDETHFRAIAGTDCLPSYETAFVVIKNITTGL